MSISDDLLTRVKNYLDEVDPDSFVSYLVDNCGLKFDENSDESAYEYVCSQVFSVKVSKEVLSGAFMNKIDYSNYDASKVSLNAA